MGRQRASAASPPLAAVGAPLPFWPGGGGPFAPFFPWLWNTLGIMENIMETTIVYWSFIRVMEKKKETAMRGYVGFRV